MTTTMTMMMPTMMPMPTTYKYNNQIMTEAETYYDIFGYNYNIASSTTSSSSNNDDETTTKTNKKRSTFDYAIRKSEYSIIKDHDESRGTKRCKSMKESPLITIAFIATTATTPTTTTLLLPEEQEQEQEQEESSSSTTTITTAPPAASPASPAPEEEPVSVSVPSVPSTTSPWVYADDTIYHETQEEGYYCGRHALNNVLQNNVFTDEELYQSAFDIVENAANAGIYEPLDEHCSDKGMFSIDVLKHATSKKLGVELEYYNNVNNNKDVTSESSHHHYHGYLCNVIISDTMKHWIAIREIGGKYYLLDSLNDKPIMIKNNDLQTTLKDIQKKNGTVFCLPKSN